jgi:hypothetical protein
MSTRSPGGERRRAWLFVAMLVASLALAFIISSAVLFVWPTAGRPQHVDAILSLNGSDEPAREKAAAILAEQGYAKVLLFSQGAYYSTPCPDVPRVLVVCFEPRPARTVGEIHFAAEYLRAHGWHSLLIVPGPAQATRARLLMRRCFSGRLVVVRAPSVPLPHLAFDVIYEWGALAKALFVDRSC